MVRLSITRLALAAGLVAAGAQGAISPQDIPSDTPVSQLLSSAQGHLARGETGDALVYYDAAISRDPNDYLTYFKRATTYLSLGRTAQATDDFNTVLTLRPGFEGAHAQLGKIRQRSADWEGARSQFKAAGAKVPQEELDTLLEAEGAEKLAEAAEKEGKWDECVHNAGVAIMVANRSPSLRLLRSRCRFEKGEVEEGMHDLQHVLSMRPGDTSPYVTISAVTFFALGDLAAGMAQIRKCLVSDPDSKVCRRLMKQQKSIEKTMAKITKAFSKNQPMTGTKLLVPSKDDQGLIKDVKDADAALREDGTIPKSAPFGLVSKVVEMACQGYYDMNNKKAKDFCEESLKLNENSMYGLLYRARAQTDNDDFEAAINTLQKAAELEGSPREMINDLLHKAQVALKRSKTKDYYKVIGVAHDADERQIKSAYRKLSKVHHPDKAVKSGVTKEEAEKKMAAINEAYEVLSNPELRARFDAGDDPMSNEQQRGNPFQGSPFGGGGHPFMYQQGGGGGGGQQQFKFQFGSGGGFPGGFPFGG